MQKDQISRVFVMDVHALNGHDELEILWVKLTEEADSEFAQGRFARALEKWQRAHDIAQGFEECDPRRACSLNNLAIAFRVQCESEQAERVYRRAIEGWKVAAQWVATMYLQGRARSSAHHFRMEVKYRKEYDHIARVEYQKALPGGRAATLNNLGELLHTTHRLQEAEQVYHQALEERMGAMGELDPGVRIIRNNMASLAEGGAQGKDPRPRGSRETVGGPAFLSQAAERRWIVDKPPEFTNEGRVMAAILLASIVPHTSLSSMNREQSAIEV